MATKDPIAPVLSLPDEVQQILLAMSVLSKRIDSLSPDDQNDLFRLLLARSKVKDEEERSSIRLAMIEILTQGEIAVKPMSLKDEESLSESTHRWADFVGQKIHKLRTKAGLTQSQLAEKSGLPQSHICRIENAEYSATHKTLDKIAKALGVSVRDIDPCVD